jgi:hypothetical protein
VWHSRLSLCDLLNRPQQNTSEGGGATWFLIKLTLFKA